MEADFEKKSHSTTYPFLKIWIKPYETVSQVVDEYHPKLVLFLVYITGVVMALNVSLNAASGDVHSIGFIMIQTLIRGVLFGFLGWFIFSGLIYWIGKLFNGTGSFKRVRTAYAWAQIPMLAQVIILWPLNYIVFGNELFTSQQVFLTVPMMALNLVTMILEFILMIWSIVMMSRSISVGHHLSGGKGLMTLLLSGMIIFAVLFGLFTYF